MSKTVLDSLNRPELRPRLIGAVLLLAALVAYLPAINAGFIWDDDLLLTANSQMQNSHGLVEIWLGRNSSDYTPLTLTTFWIEHRLWQNTAIGYHLVNVLLHVIAAVMLWRLLLALQIPGAWLAAFLFTIHPVNVASVAWIAERKNTLSAALFFGSLLLFVTGYERDNRKRLVASAGLFLFAGLSKGAVACLPLVLIGILWSMRGKVTRRDLLCLGPFALIATFIAAITMHFQAAATDYQLDASRFVLRLARAGTVPWHYFRELFVPTGLSPFSPLWQPDLRSLTTYLPPVVFVCLVSILLWKRHRWAKPLLLASGYYLCMLLPVLGIIWMTFQQQAASADWWQYLAAPGIFAAIAAGFVRLTRDQGSRAICSYVSLGLVMLFLQVQTWRQCVIYQSMESYCRAVLTENPHAWALQNNLGIVLKRRGELVPAAACYRAALQDNPRYVQAHNNLGNVLQAQGKSLEAETEFKAALQLEPRNSEVLANLSQTYFLQGEIGKALATGAEAIKAEPANPERYLQFGIILAANNQLAKAIVCFQDALVLCPDNPRIMLELARSLIASGRPGEAAAIRDSVLRSAAASEDRQVIRAFAMMRN
jgi:tetratricopeptide (TPR) repeat protein